MSSLKENKYKFFSNVATKEVYKKLNKFFEDAISEKHEHAKSILKYLKVIGDPKENFQTRIYSEIWNQISNAFWKNNQSRRVIRKMYFKLLLEQF